MQPLYPAAVTGLMLVTYFAFMVIVGRRRTSCDIPAPATTGHPDFERAFRAQANTLEHMALMLPAMWLYAAYVSELWAAVAGLVWIAGRIAYAAGYLRDPDKRGPGMLATLGAQMWMLIGGLIGVGMEMATL